MQLALMLAIVAALACSSPARSDSDCGRLETKRIAVESSILGETREVWVALPDDYDAGEKSYPVLYILDADWHFDTAVSAVRMLAETSYIQNHRIPRLIVVGIVNVDRNRDNTPTRCVSQHGMSFPTSGGADEFLTFMYDELIPLVDGRFRTHPYRILAGWSLGGLLTMQAFLDRPQVFHAHLAISPSLWWDDDLLVRRATDLAAGGARRERDVVVTIGTAEQGGLCYNAVHEFVDRWRTNPVPGASFSFLEIHGEDHNHSPYKAYLDGLRELFAEWFFPEAVFAAGLDSLQNHYAALSKRRGYRIDIPDHIFEALSRSYLANGRKADAISVARAQCARDPRSAMSFFRLGEVFRKTGDSAAARDAYRTAVELERTTSEPDSIFIQYVERMVSDLEGGE